MRELKSHVPWILQDERITKENKARIAIFSHSFLELLGLKILKVERYKMHKKFKKAVEKHDEDLREENWGQISKKKKKKK